MLKSQRNPREKTKIKDVKAVNGKTKIDTENIKVLKNFLLHEYATTVLDPRT